MICQVGVCGHWGLLGEQSLGVLSCVLIASMMRYGAGVGSGTRSAIHHPACPAFANIKLFCAKGKVLP